MSIIRNLAKKITEKLSTEREKAIALHDYVRDNMKFGFNRFFDLSKPADTLGLGVGHCNPQGELMVALFREADIEAHNHFVVLPREVLRGLVSPDKYWLIPAELSHCYTAVKVDGAWYNIDSYILDQALFKAAKAKLAEENLSIGYGTYVHSKTNWDGASDAFCQFSQDMMIEDHGRFENFDTYFSSGLYRHKIFGVKLNTIFRIIGAKLEVRSKLYLDTLREEYS